MDLLSDGSVSDSSLEIRTKDNDNDDNDNDNDDTECQEEKEEEAINKNPRKRIRKGLVTIISSEEAPTDLFQRSVPHRRGHWSGHIFIPLTLNIPTIRAMRHSIHHFQTLLETQGYSGTVVQHSIYHISLSKYFSLQLHFIEPFVQKLRLLLSMEYISRIFFHPQQQQSPHILLNDDKTRSFWSWKVYPDTHLKKLVSHIDSILNEYDQPTYYEPPIFHTSLASFNGNLENFSSFPSPPTINDPTTESDDDNVDEDKSDSDDADSSSVIVVNQVVCQFGTTKSYTINLPPIP